MVDSLPPSLSLSLTFSSCNAREGSGEEHIGCLQYSTLDFTTAPFSSGEPAASRRVSERASGRTRHVMFIAEFLTKRDNSSLKVTRLKSIFTKCSFYFVNRPTVKYTISNRRSPGRRPGGRVLLFCKNITRKGKTGLTGKISKRGPIKLICLRCRSARARAAGCKTPRFPSFCGYGIASERASERANELAFKRRLRRDRSAGTFFIPAHPYVLL